MPAQTQFDYITLKIPLDKIVKGPHIQQKLHETVKRLNYLTIHAYQFLKLWALTLYESLEGIPKITEKTIQLVFRTLTDTSKTPGRKPSNPILTEFEQLYESKYKHTGFKKVNGTNLSSIINDEISKQIFTVLETHIRKHFPKYISRYLEGVFVDFKTSKSTQVAIKKELLKVKADLLGKTLTSNPKYHEWIQTNKELILPEIAECSHYLGVAKDPQRYLPYMIYMSRALEELGRKSYGVFPLRTCCYPKYVPFSTLGIIHTLVDSGTAELQSNLTERKHEIWNRFFKLNHSIFKWNKGITFDYRMQTDGLYTSLQFIVFSQVEAKAALNTKRKTAQRRARDIRLGLINDEILENDVILEEEILENDIILEDEILENDVSLEEEILDNDIIMEDEILEDSKRSTKYEWKYLEELSDEQLSEIKSKGFVVGDPGKNTLLYLLDNEGNVLTFTKGEKKHLTGQDRFRKKLEKFQRSKGILKIEEELCDFSSKSCFSEKFSKFVEVKNKVNRVLAREYEDKIFRKLRWYGYVNKRKYYKEVGKRIKEKFGEKPIFYGDWEGRVSLKGSAPTPGIGLKRIVSRNSTIYNLDEFRTSVLSHLGEERCENLYVLKEGRVKRTHAVLTYQTLCGRRGCIGRDLNAVRNMHKIVSLHLEGKGRPHRFKRGVKLDIGP